MKKLQQELDRLVHEELTKTEDIALTTYNYFKKEENQMKLYECLVNEKLEQCKLHNTIKVWCFS
jgi:hypothetical protein